MQKYVAELITTFFYIGKIKYCPGTFGSFAAFPLVYIITYFTMINQVVFSFSSLNIIESKLLSIFIILLSSCIILFIIGIYSTSKYLKYTDKTDPSEVVIDEVVGQMFVITFCQFSVTFAQYSKIANYLSNNTIDIIFSFILPFVLFRFFDILKPWPICWLDKNIKGGIGVMVDDILAAIFATIMQYAITFMLIN